MAIASSLNATLRNPAESDSRQISRGLTAAVRRGVLRCLSACLAAPIALAITLVWTNPSQALPSGGSGGPPPPPDCAADITGKLTASPSSFNRATDLSFSTTLSWSVDVPKGCPVKPTLTLANNPAPISGHTQPFTIPNPPTTTTVSLVMTNRGLQRTLASVRIAVAGDPGLVTVSPSRQVTADDIAEFNEEWMQPWAIEAALGTATSRLFNKDSSGTTEVGERMAAMVRMFEVTHDTRYLDHLFDLIEIVLRYRDDRLFGSGPKVTDEIRNKVGLAAWGGGLLDNYGLHSVNEWTSSLYAYPIAAFARILAEDPAARARYQCNIIVSTAPDAVAEPQAVHLPRCADPIVYANRVLETVEVFLPQIHEQRVGNFTEAMLAAPKDFRSRPTAEDCNAAVALAIKTEPTKKDRWTKEYKDCLKMRDGAEKPGPHNLDLAFSKVLIELTRVLANPFYLQSPAHAPNADQMRASLFTLMPRQQRYFVDHLNPQSLKDDFDPCKVRFCWYYMEPNAEADCLSLMLEGYLCLSFHVEDTDHGSMDMTYLGPFLRDIDRLRAGASGVGEQFSLGPSQLQGFATAFADTIASNTPDGNFKSDLGGRQEGAPDDSDNLCDGWLELARVNSTVWVLCRAMSVRNVAGQQPYLRIGNHSVLLATKQFLP
jgi:hypothetical protein